MFTGIIEELGTVLNLNRQNDSAELIIEANKVLYETKIGDSIAVNGVCLTVTKIASNRFTVDIMYETLNKTNLHELKKLSKVNLERALQLNSRLGGHLVSGHVDGVGAIKTIKKVGIASLYEIAAPHDLMTFVIPKGSIAVDGISLTVVDVTSDYFSVSLIPHTFKHTTLGFKTIGDTVNLETDIIGKYVARLLNQTKDTDRKKDISMDFLSKYGFI